MRIKIRKTNKGKRAWIIILGVILLIIILLGYYFINGNASLTSENILGEWKAISEETAGGVSYEVDAVLSFNEDGSYRLTEYPEYGIEENGKYKIFENKKILFYQTDDELNAYIEGRGRFNDAYGEIKQGKLILLYPLYPKTVVYEK